MAISVRQATSNSAGSTTTVTATFNSATLAGSVIVVAGTGITASGSTTITLSDSASDAYTDSGIGDDTTGDLIACGRIGAFLAPATGVTTVTATFGSSNTFIEVVAWEITGLTNPTFDQAITGKATTGTSMSVGPTGTLLKFVEIGLAYLISLPGANGSSQGSGWTAETVFNAGTSNGGNGLTNNSNFMEHIITSVNSALTATATQASSSGYDAFLVTLYSNVATSTGGTFPLMGVG